MPNFLFFSLDERELMAVMKVHRQPEGERHVIAVRDE